MAATKVSKDENLLVIDIIGGDKTYGNASWFEIVDFEESSVTLFYQGGARPKYYKIAFSDFQDGSGTPINTEADIVDYLKDKIG